MNLAEDVELEEFVTTKDDLSGADIKAVCTEAGLLALRERRMRVTKADFTSAREKVRQQYHHACLSVLTCPTGVVQEERGHPGRTLPVICILLSLSCICYIPSSLHSLRRVCSPKGIQCLSDFFLTTRLGCRPLRATVKAQHQLQATTMAGDRLRHVRHRLTSFPPDTLQASGYTSVQYLTGPRDGQILLATVSRPYSSLRRSE